MRWSLPIREEGVSKPKSWMRAGNRYAQLTELSYGGPPEYTDATADAAEVASGRGGLTWSDRP